MFGREGLEYAVGKSPGFAAEDEYVAGPVIWPVKSDLAIGIQNKLPALADGIQSGRKAVMRANVGIFVIIQTGAAHSAIGQVKSGLPCQM